MAADNQASDRSVAKKTAVENSVVKKAVFNKAVDGNPQKTRADAYPFENNNDEIRTFVLDTSVLLSDPGALKKFAEHDVVLPLTVITELEAKRHHLELGYFARATLRALDELRSSNGGLDKALVVNSQGGSLRVELNHVDPQVLPAGFRLGDNDSRILAVAANLAAEGCSVTVVSKDLPMRIKASAVGLVAEEYQAEMANEFGWTGVATMDVPEHLVKEMWENEDLDLTQLEEHISDDTGPLITHRGVVLHSARGSALARVTPDKHLQLVRGDQELFGLRGRSAEQRIAIDLLLDDSIGIVSLGGRAGTGKSALALCAGLEAVLERGTAKKIMVFRPLYAVGGQELGYLPGSESEKMNPWAQAVFDTLGAIISPNVLAEIEAQELLEVLPLTHIRGRSLHDAYVIVDEAQSLERNVLLTVLSRLGSGSRVVLTHDVAQRDNLRVGRYDGVAAVVEKLKGHPLFGHVTLTRSERSPIAALVTDLLERESM